MSYPENVGIKAMEIYFPAQVNLHIQNTCEIELSFLTGKSAWINPYLRSTRVSQLASTLLDWASST